MSIGKVFTIKPDGRQLVEPLPDYVESDGTITGTNTHPAGTVRVEIGGAPFFLLTAGALDTTIPPPQWTNPVGFQNWPLSVPITPIDLTNRLIGTGPFTYSVTGLPAGVGHDGNGMISGTPTALATGVVSYSAIGPGGTAPASFGFNVTGSSPVWTNPVGFQNWVVGAAITPINLVGRASGTGPITYAVSGLPAGVSHDGSGLISGTPTALANGTVSYSSTNAVGTTPNSFGYSNTGVAPDWTNPIGNQVNLSGSPITPVDLNGRFSVTHGAGVVTSTALPSGLTLSGNIVSGTPDPLSYPPSITPVTFTVTDALNQTDTFSIFWTIDNPIPDPVYPGGGTGGGTGPGDGNGSLTNLV